MTDVERANVYEALRLREQCQALRRIVGFDNQHLWDMWCRLDALYRKAFPSSAADAVMVDIADLELPTRFYNVLMHAGMTNCAALHTLGADGLLRIRGAGVGLVASVRSAFDHYGWTLL